MQMMYKYGLYTVIIYIQYTLIYNRPYISKYIYIIIHILKKVTTWDDITPHQNYRLTKPQHTA